jgi:hypothetical protein
MLTVTIDTTQGVKWTAPRVLFDADFLATYTAYDVATDGRLVMIAPDPEERAPLHFNVVLNWASELLTRVPVLR